MNQINLFAECINAIFDLESSSAIKILKSITKEDDAFVAPLIRIAALCPGHQATFYQQLCNLWEKQDKPRLKPNVRSQRLALLTDFTADPLVRPLQLMAAARGVDLDISLPGFDSVEQSLFDANSSLYRDQYDSIVLLLSEHWLDKYLGATPIIDLASFDNTKELLNSLLVSASNHSDAQIVVGTFYNGAWPNVTALTKSSSHIGRKAAIDELNQLLLASCDSRISLCDTATAIHLAGGAAALGRRNYLLAKMAFENSGVIAVSRELAAVIADLCGQTHRACALDWDNTLWGGELAELGAHAVVCGFNSPEANAYRMLQHQLKGLTSIGVLLAAISRNNPELASAIDENPDIPLNSADFSSTQINFIPKSESISAACEELGFGSEYFVFMDDSTFELAEVLMSHPYIDLIRSEKDPEFTLQRLVESRLFNKTRLNDSDLARSDNAENLKKQRAAKMMFKSNDDFLNSINITLKVEALNESNASRVLQLIGKTNQFNVSTRRHTQADLDAIIAAGGDVWAFSYEDNFGSQGIISVVVTRPQDDSVFIDTWLMSCRVLNRTVEFGIFAWLIETYQNHDITAEYIATEKNALVKDFFKDLHFDLHESRDDHSAWVFKKDNPFKANNFIKAVIRGDMDNE